MTQWNTADAIAQELFENETDVNELAKVSTYLNSTRDPKAFFRLLDWMAQAGDRVARSRQTPVYYRNINAACQRLRDLNDVNDMAQTLGWAVRLMRYYPYAKTVKPLSDIRPAPRRPGAQPDTTLRPSRLEDLEPGMVLRGQVRKIVKFGAFVDIGVGRDGLVHISELSERYVKKVEDVVAVGDDVQVRVKDVDRSRKRIGLSMKGVPQEE